jgi:hypothetical protein
MAFKGLLPASITCDTACEAMRHYRLLRLSKVAVRLTTDRTFATQGRGI